ncbi:hamartin-like [Ctenocephalides felis]|uniref:hamartin-like n=1 Tax=Ctenocephalides felis TaxID=7515 RepID=UPI000E6E4491|nr:hamartin-like [Ctenocephalides felis]
MEMEELFNSLESDNLQVVEDVKKQFADYFNKTKESWLVTFLIDYYLQTNSVRVVDVLLKVQSPHDRFIFDRILDLIKSSNKQKGLDILGIIVRRQPTWLYHIMQHNLFKETLKLLKVETDIVPFMSALLCIIALLPMVPSLISPFLMDIFEVFSRLAAWKGNNTTKLPEDQLIHLQVGLYALFHRLYGMFPCNFVSYLKNKYSSRDQSVIFGHTIKPLLETVKMHPLLITTSKERETDNSRWKNMEVHDVVVECSRVMLENIERPDNQEYIGSNSKHIDCSSINFENSNLSRSHIITSQDFHASKMVDRISENKEFWSPSFTCPPTTPPQTPTPVPNTHSYTPNITPSLMASNINTNLLKNDGQEGASPPEAAIEATPESTPLRDMRIRPIPPSSTVARALNTKLLTSSVSANQSLNSSQPSSPMRKDPSLFRYPDPTDIETSSTSFQKLTRVISDRSQSQLENNASLFRYTNPTSPMRVSSHSDAFHNNITTSDAAQNTSEFSVDNLDFSNMSEKDTINNSGENDLTEENVNQEDQFVDCIPASCTTCTSGGLHVPNSRSMKNFAEHIKRLRFYSQCNNDNISGGYYKGFSAGSSPADSSVILPKSKHLDIVKVPKIEEVVDAPEEKEVKKEESQKPIVARSVQNNSTQTVSFWPQPFELLYIGLFPFGDNCSSKRNSAKDTIKQSPTDLLDQYIQCCINRQKSHGSDDRYNENAEIRSLREQLQLLHIELQFERHRRELHADRNRRLLGKCRDNRALEESNAALKERLQLFENDIQKLNQELGM